MITWETRLWGIANKIGVEASEAVSDAVLRALKSGLFGTSGYNDRSGLPRSSGIYIVVRGSQVLYVGQSVNIKNRFSTHPRGKEFAKIKNEVSIFWFKVDEELLPDVEKVCINELQPELNIRLNPNIERHPTSQIRLYDEDKPEFEELQKWLTMQLGGEPVPQAAVIHYLLEIYKKSS